MKKIVVLSLAAFAIACSSPDKSEDAAPAGKDKPSLSEVWEWPSASGQPRDLSKDDAACRERPKDVAPLVGLKMYHDCMAAKGWTFNPPKKKGSSSSS